MDEMRSKALQYAGEARRHGYRADVLTWHTALDNYEPVPRAYASGYAVKYSGTLVQLPACGDKQNHAPHDWTLYREGHAPDETHCTGETFTAEYPTAGIIMSLTDSGLSLDKVRHSIALFDYGNVVYPYYCAGWNAENRASWGLTDYVMWHPFPVAADGDTTADGRPLDYSTWQLGPRRAYHFKVAGLREDRHKFIPDMYRPSADIGDCCRYNKLDSIHVA